MYYSSPRLSKHRIVMKLKHLESALSSVNYKFHDPKIKLEQYPTSAQLAAAVAWTAHAKGDLGPGIQVLDLGCGTGMLTIAAAIMCQDSYNEDEIIGEIPIIAVDCCFDALEQAEENCREMEIEVDFIRAELRMPINSSSSKDIEKLGRRGLNNRKGCRGGKSKSHGGRGKHQPSNIKASPHLSTENDEISNDNRDDGIPLNDNSVDTVLTNPPFGTKQNSGADLAFLKCACRLSRNAVYSFHKTSTREFLLRKANEWGMGAEVVAEMKFDIPAMYKFHKEKNVDVHVDLLRLWHLPYPSKNDDKCDL